MDTVNEWTATNNFHLPKGVWLVRVEKEMLGSDVHVAVKQVGGTFIGCQFDYECPKIISYRSIPQ